MKKKIILLFLFVITTSLLISDTIEKTFNFEYPKISKKGKYTTLTYKKCVNYAAESQPELPHFNVNMLIPNGEILKEIKIIKVTYYEKLENIIIKPASAQFPISKPVKNYKLKMDKKTYNLNLYPKSPIQSHITSYLCGHSIGSFGIIPIKYFPKQKKVLPIKEITIKIVTSKSDDAKSALKNFKSDNTVIERLKKIVENFNDYNRFYNINTSKNRDTEYDLLIITNENLSQAFQNYINFKQSTGYFVALKTTQEIYSQYSGIDNQEKIRNCIIDYYQNYGISFVLLGGDADTGNSEENIIPARGMTVILGYPDYPEYDEYNLPSDIYYSNLDGNWNSDNDNLWGEVGEIDYYSEISVGRISADSSQEVGNFTHKLILYQEQPVIQDIKKALMLGEMLDGSTSGGNYKDEIVYGGNNNGYYTNPLPFTYQVSKLYERDENWSKNDVFNQFNTVGVHLLNHLGHSDIHYNMKMDTGDLNTNNFTNDGINRSFVIGYSQGCYNGAFDNRDSEGSYSQADCFAEKITNMQTGEVATIANSRYGWYSPGNTNSSSQYYDRQFFDTIFSQDIYKVGSCNSFAKEKDVMLINNDPFYRWSAFATNLLGDPSMDIWTDVPTDFEYVSLPQTINVGSNGMEIILPDVGATVAVCNGNELLGRVKSNQASLVQIDFIHPINEICQLTVTVTKHNKNKFTGVVNVVPTNAPYLVPIDFTFVELEGIYNQIIDHGETLKLFFTIKNVGEVTANNVTVSLTTEDNYMEILSNNIAFGNIEHNMTIENSQPFIVKISPYCPDNHNLEFTVNINSSEDEWQFEQTLLVNSPDLNILSYDTFTQNNNYIMPSDEAFLSVTLKNNGVGIADNVSAKISTNDSYISIENSQITIGDIGGLGEIQIPDNFTFHISDDCPVIYNFNLNLELTDELGYYNIIQIPINIGYKNTVEAGEASWTHYSLNQMVDQWHITDNRFFSYSHSWKVGGNDFTNYYNNLKCALESPLMNIEQEDCYLKFSHWIDAEINQSSENECYDGGLVEIYYNGSWQILTPIDGYPYSIIGNNNPPFDTGTGVFSGSFDWQNAYFDLSNFSGQVKFRWIFGSDGAIKGEGWYIDDIAIVSEIQTLTPPSNLLANLQGSIVNLVWEDTESHIDNYKVYRKKENDENYYFIGNSDTTSYTDNLEEAGKYFYVVTSLRDEEESLYSNFVVVEYAPVNSNNDVVQNKLRLTQNYPNPFNPTTTISFNLPEKRESVNLSVYNIKGEKVITLIDAIMEGGSYKIVWNGKNKFGKRVSSGVYFYKLNAGNSSIIKKMLMLK